MLPPIDTFGIGPATASAATPFYQLIPPYRGAGGKSPRLYLLQPGSNLPNWWGAGGAITRVSSIRYSTGGSTAQNIGIMRPLNWTYFSVAVAKNITAVTLATDPGLYSTSYKYPTPGSAVPTLVADNAIATNDHVAYQLDDGSWQHDTIASGTFAGGNLVLTTGTPNRAGATIAKNRPIFFFGVITDTDPANGLGHEQILVPASTAQGLYQDTLSGVGGALHPGDPLVFYSANSTNAGTLDQVSGFFYQP